MLLRLSQKTKETKNFEIENKNTETWKKKKNPICFSSNHCRTRTEARIRLDAVIENPLALLIHSLSGWKPVGDEDIPTAQSDIPYLLVKTRRSGEEFNVSDAFPIDPSLFFGQKHVDF